MVCSHPYYFSPMPRRKSVPVDIGGVVMGGDAPIVIQSMTNTDTADVENSVKQVQALFEAGSEIVRLTVDRDESARAIPRIHEKLLQKGLNVPLVGDFHYIGHQLLADHPECAQVLSKYRINPGNIGFKQKKDLQFSSIVEIAIKYDKPVRIGVNWGSLDQELLTVLMDKNKTETNPRSDQEVIHEAIIQSALLSAQFAESIGLTRDKIVLSAKVSQVQDLFSVSTRLAALSDYALHLGLTEAGMGVQGMVSSSAALGMLLQMGIGDTIRISLTPEPGGDRSLEVQVARQLLQSLGLRRFFPSITACPGCGRTTSSYFQELSRRVEDYVKEHMPVWSKEYPGSESLKVAVMGCIVNGPGESKHANIGISLPGTGEHPVAPVYIDGVKVATLRGENLAVDFEEMIFNYVREKYKKVA